MRPTVIRLIAGGALGVAFSISLTLPGSVVFPSEPPVRHLAAPKAPTATVLHAAPVTRTKAPARRRVVVRRGHVPTAVMVRAPSVVRREQPRSKSPRKPEHAPVPVSQSVTPLTAPSPVSEPSDEPKRADEQGDDEPRKADRPRSEKSRKAKAEKPWKAHKPRKSDRPRNVKKPKGHGSGKHDGSNDTDDEDRDDQGDHRNGHDRGKHGRGRDDDGDRG